MKILFVIGSCKQYVNGNFIIDRVDLARRVPLIHTWVDDAIYAGHDVIFFEGGHSTEYYDERTRTLHLAVDDLYEPDPSADGSVVLSRLYIKHQAAYKWVLNNKEFDKVFVCDDDVYVNLQEFMKMDLDVDFTFLTGGAGFIFSRKALEIIVNHVNTTHRVADHAFANAIQQNITDGFVWGHSETYERNQAFYIPGELAPTVHYVSGKRVYHLHNIIKNFKETGVTNRKILLGAPLDSTRVNWWDTVTYLTQNKDCMPRWYDFTTDPNGWEYHAGYQRSTISFTQLINGWPYAENATKYFVLTPHTLLGDIWESPSEYYKYLDQLIKKCEYSLIDANNLILCYHKTSDRKLPPFELTGWRVDNSVKDSLKLNFELLNECDFYVKDGVSHGQ